MLLHVRSDVLPVDLRGLVHDAYALLAILLQVMFRGWVKEIDLQVSKKLVCRGSPATGQVPQVDVICTEVLKAL